MAFKIIPNDKNINEATIMKGSKGNKYIDFKDSAGVSHLVKINIKNDTFIFKNIKYIIQYI